MSLNPYRFPPRKLFVVKMLGPTIGVFLLSVYGIGPLSQYPLFKQSPEVITGEAAFPVHRIGEGTGWGHYLHLLQDLAHVPGPCVGDRAVNDVQRIKCQFYWKDVYLNLGLGALPFLAVILFWMIGLDRMVMQWRSVRKMIDKGQAPQKGIVTNPALTPNDFFGWIFCLQSVSVELPNQKQIRVYTALDTPIPLPGETLLVYTKSGRHFGVLYAPHIAVVAGGRH